MGVRLADAYVNIGTDDKELGSGLGAAQLKVSQFGAMMAGALAGLGAMVAQKVVAALSGAVDQLKQAARAASDLRETASKTGEVFGDQAGVIGTWAAQAANAFGQSKRQAMDAASNFAIFGKAAGLTGERLVGFSTELTELASDLASFNNTTVDESITALGAALRGESEPIRRYGVLLDEATLRAKAFSLGLTEDANTTLTQQQRVLAAQAAIFEQTKTQQGDFARTATEAANSERTLAAQAENLRAVIGSGLLPVWKAVLEVLRSAAERVMPGLEATMRDRVTPAMQRFADMIAPLAERVIAFGGHVTALASGPLTALGRLVRDEVTPALAGMWSLAGEKLAPAFETLAGVVNTVLVPAFVALKIATGNVWGLLGSVVSLLWERFKPALQETGATVQSQLNVYLLQLSAFVQERVLPALTRFWEYIQTSMLPALVALAGRLKELYTTYLVRLQEFITAKVVPAWNGFRERVMAFVNDTWPILKKWFENGMKSLQAFVEGFEKGSGGTGEALKNLAAAVGHLLDGILALVESVIVAFLRLVDVLNGEPLYEGFGRIGQVFGWLIEQITLVLDMLGMVVKAIAAVLRGDWSAAGEAIQEWANPAGTSQNRIQTPTGEWIPREEWGEWMRQWQSQGGNSNSVTVNINAPQIDTAAVGSDVARAVQAALRAGGY